MMLTGDNGLLNQAGNAKEVTGIAQIEEAIDLSVTGAFALDPLGDLTTENLKTTLAQNMPTDYELSGDETSGWTVEVPSIDKTYEINNSGNIGEYVPVPVTVANLQESGETVTKNTTITDDDRDTMTIPGEFKIASDSATDIDEGVVVEAPDGSQFVWVPVPDINTMAKATSGTDSNGRTNYQGKLYDFSGTTATEKTSYGQGTTSLREPGLVTGDSSDTYAILDSVAGTMYDANGSYYNTILGYDSAEDFGKSMQEEYNAMVESVAKYGGFFVGRYETSYDTNNSRVASVKNVTSANASNENTKYWYGLYKTQKEYASKCSFTSVQSSMIWESQYDAMLIWMCSQGIDVTSSTPIEGASGNTGRVTGATETDKLNNIYDLLGNSYEGSLEACNEWYRVSRGGGCNNAAYPSDRCYGDNPAGNYGYGYYHSSRITLYVK